MRRFEGKLGCKGQIHGWRTKDDENDDGLIENTKFSEIEQTEQHDELGYEMHQVKCHLPKGRHLQEQDWL